MQTALGRPQPPKRGLLFRKQQYALVKPFSNEKNHRNSYLYGVINTWTHFWANRCIHKNSYLCGIINTLLYQQFFQQSKYNHSFCYGRSQDYIFNGGCIKDLPSQQAGAQKHLAVFFLRSQNWCFGTQRGRQIQPVAHYCRPGQQL